MNFYVKTGSGAITDTDKVFGIENDHILHLYKNSYVNLPDPSSPLPENYIRFLWIIWWFN